MVLFSLVHFSVFLNRKKSTAQTRKVEWVYKYKESANGVKVFHCATNAMLWMSPQCTQYLLINLPFWPHLSSHSLSLSFSPQTLAGSAALPQSHLFFCSLSYRFPSLVIWPKFFLVT